MNNIDQKTIFLSVVIPAYNEEKRISDTLMSIHNYLSSKGYGYEVIVVDDGSSDGTIRTVSESLLAREGNGRVLENGTNRGKGFSVRNGMKAAVGEYVLVSDADASTPINDIEKLLPSMEDGSYDIVIGSRDIKGANVCLHQPWYRELMGKVFNLMVRMLVLGGFHDTQCGFKLFRRSSITDVVSELKIDGFCYDVETLYLAKKNGLTIKEVGVAWENSIQSKVKLFDSSFSMFTDLLKIKKLHRE